MIIQRLCLNSHDELFVIDLRQVLYFLADDHYAHVFYASGIQFMVPFGLSRIEEKLIEQGVADRYVRMGRKHIVNTKRIFGINTIKEQLFLYNDKGESVVIHMPKPVLRNYLASASLG